MVWATVGEGALDPAALEASVRRRAAGAVVTFSGVVRDQDGGRAVASREYSAHPAAEGMLARLAVEQLAAHPAVQAMAVGHRVGPLEVGDVAFAAACSAAHRADAFAACADLVDAVKAGLPVWKRQHFDNGDDEWVGL
ncbi:MAG: molybdenum cofactor biosynthesis protein MoaE [Propionibacteriaceae bacterium]|nr:molybdenum cofactor biosynthesis protein MoaE [Propionibacteriaceae bacterium]